MNKAEKVGGLVFESDDKSNFSQDSQIDWSQLIRERHVKEKTVIEEHEDNQRKWGLVFRLIAAFILPVISYIGLCGSKVCLLILGDRVDYGIDPENNPDDVSITAKAYAWISIGITGSYAVSMVFNLFIASSREKRHPSAILAFWGVLTGVIESFGIGLLALYVVTTTTTAFSLSVFCCLTAITRFNDMVEYGMVIMAVSAIVRISMIATIAVLIYLQDNTALWYIVPIGMICSTCSYWTTKYISEEKKRTSYWIAFYKNMATALCSFGWAICIWGAYFGSVSQLFEYGYSYLDANHWDGISYAGVFFPVATALGYTSAWWCCSVRFQRIGFAAPIALASPTALIWVTLYIYLTYGYIDTSDAIPEVCLFLGIWLGQCWLTRHSWNENIFPGAISNAMWYHPSSFSAVIVEQVLLVNRRTNTLKLKLIRNNTTGMTDTTSLRSSDLEMINAVHGSPLCFIATTMWHENEAEMESVMSSYYRMDKGCRGDRTQYEIHVMFDNSIDTDGCWNEWVALYMNFLPPFNKEDDLLRTPYGYQMRFTLPYGTPMTIHLKDKSKIKIKKRWSQIMYMFYVLRYRTYCDNLDPDSTYILVTDGDVSFDVPGIHDLLIHLQRSSTVGGVCSRIHPIGKGFIAWYQCFEYALGQWLLKCAEEVFGSVLCLPGAFSLYRASAVECCMYAYALKTDNAANFLKYDQGEDRWFSTLMVMNGWLLQYSASADAYTFCPEEFDEFFHQRRRWVTSTWANTIEIIKRTKQMIRNNMNISLFFIGYQFILLFSSFCCPMIVVFLITAGLNFGFGVDPYWTVVICMLFVLAFCLVTVTCVTTTQITIARYATYATAILMIFVTVGFITPLLEDPDTFASIVVMVTSAFIIIAALLHPRELVSVPCGLVFVLLIPMGYVLLLLFSIGNINTVSWGTREGKKQLKEEEGNKSKSSSWLSSLAFWKYFGKSQAKHAELEEKKKQEASEKNSDTAPLILPFAVAGEKSDLKSIHSHVTEDGLIDEMDNDTLPYSNLDDYDCKLISIEEENFWNQMLKAVLKAKPKTEEETQKQAELLEELTALRNKCMSAIVSLQVVLAVLFLVLHNRTELYVFNTNIIQLPQMAFTSLIVLQFMALLWHRWKTAMHIIGTAGWEGQAAGQDV